MKKKIILLLILVYAITLIPQSIDQITAISFNRAILEAEQWMGSIVGYEDRLFVNSLHQIREFLLHDNGSMELLSMYEGGVFHQTPVIADEKLYVFNNNNMMILD